MERRNHSTIGRGQNQKKINFIIFDRSIRSRDKNCQEVEDMIRHRTPECGSTTNSLRVFSFRVR